jgi:hypothetical protein
MRSRGLAHSVTFLVKAPFILLILLVINVVTSPGHWWVQWPALGLGIAWIINLMRVLRAAVVVGGLAGLVALLTRR